MLVHAQETDPLHTTPTTSVHILSQLGRQAGGQAGRHDIGKRGRQAGRQADRQVVKWSG